MRYTLKYIVSNIVRKVAEEIKANSKTYHPPKIKAIKPNETKPTTHPVSPNGSMNVSKLPDIKLSDNPANTSGDTAFKSTPIKANTSINY